MPSTKFIKIPAIDTKNLLSFPLLKFLSSIGTGFAQPNPNKSKNIKPFTSMWASGAKVHLLRATAV